ncbi:hypothetical protein V7168_05910 [Neobacillus drentensis]
MAESSEESVEKVVKSAESRPKLAESPGRGSAVKRTVDRLETI